MLDVDSLPVALRLGPVHLTVSDLERSASWYERSLGLRVEAGADRAELGDGVATLVVLHEDRDAQPDGDHAGLFHYCLLYPTREELARAAVRLEETSTPVSNFRDRGTHEAIYLPDPDGNAVELAWDRARELWPDDPYGHTPVPLDAAALRALVADEAAAPSVAEGLAVGHVHFTIGDVEQAVDFYSRALGFDLKYHVGPAAFFSVGGYHHQVAANVWKGVGLAPKPPRRLGIHHWTIELAGEDEVEAARARLQATGNDVEPIPHGFACRDPWNIQLHVVA